MPQPNLALVSDQDRKPLPLAEHSRDLQAQLRLSEARRIAFPKIERLCRPSSNRFWVLGGEPGSFKTKLAWNIALNLARMHKSTLFVSLEMHPTRLALMHHAADSGLDERRIIHAFEPGGRAFNAQEQERFDRAHKRWEEIGSYLEIHDGERDGWRLKDVLASCTRVWRSTIIVDHGRLLAQDRLDLVSPTVEALRKLTRGKNQRPWVIAVWPLNRDAPRERTDNDVPRMPRASDFWGGSCVEYAADTAVVLQKRAKLDDESPTVPVDAFVVKNRDGPAPTCVALSANGSTSTVVERGGNESPPPQHWANRESGED